MLDVCSCKLESVSGTWMGRFSFSWVGKTEETCLDYQKHHTAPYMGCDLHTTQIPPTCKVWQIIQYEKERLELRTLHLSSAVDFCPDSYLWCGCCQNPSGVLVHSVVEVRAYPLTFHFAPHWAHLQLFCCTPCWLGLPCLHNYEHFRSHAWLMYSSSLKSHQNRTIFKIEFWTRFEVSTMHLRHTYSINKFRRRSWPPGMDLLLHLETRL